MAKAKEYTVTIGLYQDRMTPRFKCLILEGADLRIGGGKASGAWDLVQKFKCSFTEADLKSASSSNRTEVQQKEKS